MCVPNLKELKKKNVASLQTRNITTNRSTNGMSFYLEKLLKVVTTIYIYDGYVHDY